MKRTFIGDVHGKWTQYRNLIIENDLTNTIQVGDFGIGMPRETKEEREARDEVWAMGNHRFIRGNHDSPTGSRLSAPNYISDGHYEDGIFFVGGASSIDRGTRVEGYNWWADEELSYDDFYLLMESYEKLKPRVIVSHDCPDEVAHRLFSWYKHWETPSRTRQALDSMLHIHKPDIHIFGHWHEWRDEIIDGVRYICIPELEYMEIEL